MVNGNKMCPLTNMLCVNKRCMFWCDWGRDCAVPLLAGMFADSEICRNVFIYGDESYND